MLKIGDFSKMSRISIRMLRHYDDMGLLKPKTIDQCTGYRFYAEDQMLTAARIIALRDMGFNVSSIKEIMMHYHEAESLRSYLIVKQSELEAEALEIEKRMTLLKTAIKQLREDGVSMQYHVNVKTFPSRYVASVRKVIPSYNDEGQLWQTMMQETCSQNLQPADMCNSLAMFHDDGYKESDVDVEVQMTVKGKYNNTANVVFKEEPELLVASATYKGSYDQITEVNHAVAKWVEDNGYNFAGLMFCVYHVSPNQTQNPEEYVTEVCYTVEKL